MSCPQHDPYTMSRGSELEGYCIDLISELSQKLGFSFKIHLVKDARYGALNANGSWSGMIGEVMRGVSIRDETAPSSGNARV